MRSQSWKCVLTTAMGIALTGCTIEEGVSGVGNPPAAPLSFTAYYHAQSVHLSWQLSTRWNGELFRIYSRRVSGPDYVSIAEVTNCNAGTCSFSDVNVAPGVAYLYYVSAVDPRSGAETASASAVQVQVPQPVPPPVPTRVQVVTLDNANYVRWDGNARSAGDFSHYRVWLQSQGQSYVLGETDSEGFLDLLARNGTTYTYFVTSLDTDGHQSQGSASTTGTPRPDFHNEWVFDYFDVPGSSGFRFQSSDEANPIVAGTSVLRHFRLEVDGAGWWLVPGPNVTVYPGGFATTALKCGPGSDASCEALERAPSSGYVSQDVSVAAQTTYVVRVRGDDGQNRYGAIRVQVLGYDGTGRALMIFDWAYQLQPGNLNLAPQGAPTR